MNKIIGYKAIFEFDNNEINEWHRIHRYETDVFTKKEQVKLSLEMIKNKKIKDAKNENQEYIDFQYDCEIHNKRSTREFLCKARLSLMAKYKEILKFMRCFKIIPVYAQIESNSELHIISFE